MLKKSDLFESEKKLKEQVVTLHSCRTGRTTTVKGAKVESFAQKMSRAFETTIIAPDERDWFNFWGEKGPMQAKGQDANGDVSHDPKFRNAGGHTISAGVSGFWLVYKNGELVGAYSRKWLPNGDNFNSSKKVNVTYTTTGDNINLRSGAGRGFKPVGGALAKGVNLTPTGNAAVGWVEVSTSDGRTGWISSKLVEAKYDKE